MQEKDGRTLASLDQMESGAIGGDVAVLPWSGNPNRRLGIRKVH